MSESDAKSRTHTFLVVRQPGRQDHIVVWDTQDISVGRGPDNDLSVDLAELSRRHALFKREGEVHAVCNLSNSNETLVRDQPVLQQSLETNDVVRMAELEILFYRGRKNPLAAGLKVEYASQLKQFSGMSQGPEAGDVTMLGLMESLPGEAGDELDVAPPGDFEYDLQGIASGSVGGSGTRDLDLEIGPEGESRSLSLHVELQGLTSDLRNLLESLVGKEIELPKLRIKVKGDDLT